MEFVKYFQKQTNRSHRCTIPVKKIDDNDVEHEQECGDTISVSKDSYFNLKRHIMRKHDSVLREHGEEILANNQLNKFCHTNILM